MAPKQAAPGGGTEKRKARRTGAEMSASNTPQRPDRERQLVDIDPWAMLLEQLMEVPDETAGDPPPAKPGKGRPNGKAPSRS
jgi:hypothetical protein